MLLESIRWLHIAAGAVALLIFWIPLVVKKGASVHVRVGWVYVSAMIAVAITAAVVCGYRIVYQPGRRDLAVFLLLVSVLAASSAVGGVRALREKRRDAPTRRLRNLALPVLLVASAIAVEIYGLRIGSTLMAVFPLVALATGLSQLAYWLRPPRTRMHGWLRHMGDMGGACIATVTAFTVVNASRLGLAVTSLAVWIAPGIIGGIGIALWTRYYRRKFASLR